MLINTPASLPPSSRFQLAPNLQIFRILNGMWQVSGAHGSIDPEKAVESMFTYLDAGFTTWDLADHYGPAEDFIGEFRRSDSFSYAVTWAKSPVGRQRPLSGSGGGVPRYH